MLHLLLLRRPGTAAGASQEVNLTEIKGGIRGIPMLWGWTRASCISSGCWLRVDGYSGARGCSSPPHLHARCWGGWGLAYYATCCGQVLHGNECAPRTQCVSNIRGRHGFQWLWERPHPHPNNPWEITGKDTPSSATSQKQPSDVCEGAGVTVHTTPVLLKLLNAQGSWISLRRDSRKWSICPWRR